MDGKLCPGIQPSLEIFTPLFQKGGGEVPTMDAFPTAERVFKSTKLLATDSSFSLLL